MGAAVNGRFNVLLDAAAGKTATGATETIPAGGSATLAAPVISLPQ
jgi:hypothetical protein